MSKFYYEMPVDSRTGALMTRFWQQAMKCDQAAEDYAKKMGAAYYYKDPRYFAGGVVCIAFGEDQRIDRSVWRESGVSHDDEQTYYEPDCEMRTGTVEIPNREYALKDTFDRFYERGRIIEKNGRLYVAYVEFYRDEVTGTSNGSKGGRKPTAASRSARKAIRAEMMRQRLPVIETERLLEILGVRLTSDMVVASTPTFFCYRSRYWVGVDYDCSGNGDLKPITPQMYNMNRESMLLEARRRGEES